MGLPDARCIRACGRATFVARTCCLPEERWDAFLGAVQDRYQFVGADGPQDVHTFQFYQLEVALTPAG